MKYYGGCDVGSTYAKCVILDENGKIAADNRTQQNQGGRKRESRYGRSDKQSGRS